MDYALDYWVWMALTCAHPMSSFFFQYQPEPERKQESGRKQESERQPKRQSSY